MWNVEKIVKKGAYLYAVVRQHPKATRHGYVLHHRIVMENAIGRLLDDDELVHHKNDDKHDNRIENLEIKSNVEHARLHALKRGMAMCRFRCPRCKRVFVRRKGNSHLVKGGIATFCSRTCRASFYATHKFGETADMNRAISANLVMEFRSNDNAEQTVTTGCVETVRLTPEMVMTQSSQQAA